MLGRRIRQLLASYRLISLPEPDAHLALPQTERVAASVITLPTGQAITPETIRVVCDIIPTAVENADEICKLFKGKPPA
jgi:dTDP-4-amino-4,6-dideoxygalactose transaminase